MEQKVVEGGGQGEAGEDSLSHQVEKKVGPEMEPLELLKTRDECFSVQDHVSGTMMVILLLSQDSE